MSNKRCETCRYFEAVKRTRLLGDGDCHRYPPTIAGTGSYIFPDVEGSDWCGEYEQAESKGESGIYASWISVDDKLPDDTGNVLACDQYKQIWLASFYKYSNKTWTDDRGDVITGSEITHWIPLPNRPESEAGQ